MIRVSIGSTSNHISVAVSTWMGDTALLQLAALLELQLDHGIIVCDALF